MVKPSIRGWCSHNAEAIGTRPDVLHRRTRISGAASSSFTRTMSNFDFSAPAELFAAHGRMGLRYRRFPKRPRRSDTPLKSCLAKSSRDLDRGRP